MFNEQKELLAIASQYLEEFCRQQECCEKCPFLNKGDSYKCSLLKFTNTLGEIL